MGDICNKDLLQYQPQHIYQALWAKARYNDLDVCEKLIQRCINRYSKEDIINNFQTLTYFYQKQKEGEEVRDKNIYLHSSLALKIKRIQLDLNNCLSNFLQGLFLGPQLYSCIVITLTTGIRFFVLKWGY